MEWERTNDETIDISDIIHGLFGTWKWIVLCGAVFAVLLGAYKYNQYLHPAKNKDFVKQAEKVQLTSVEQQAVQSAKNAMDNILRIQDYMDKSVYININPNQVNKVTLLYGISNATKADKRQIIENYLSYINNGGVVKYVREENPEYKDLGVAYLSELISATKSATQGQEQTLVLENEDMSSWFYIQVLGDDMEQAKRLANQVQNALKKYFLEVNEKVGKHSLDLMNEQEAEIYDKNLSTSLSDYNTKLSDNKSRVENLTAGFSNEQNIVYNAYLQEKGLVLEIKDKVTLFQVLIFAVAGMITGAFLYCCAYAIFYLYSGTVKSVQELERKYTFRVFGEFCLKGKKALKSASKEQDKLIQKIELLCADEDIKEIGILPTLSLEGVAEKKVQELQERLEKKGIQSKLVVDICEKPEQWEELRHIGHAIPVFDMGHTTYREINEEMSFCQENKIQVLGTIAVER